MSIPRTLMYAQSQAAPSFRQKPMSTRKYWIDWGAVRTGEPTLNIDGVVANSVEYDEETNRSSFEITLQTSGIEVRVTDETGYHVDFIVWPAQEPRLSSRDYV